MGNKVTVSLGLSEAPLNSRQILLCQENKEDTAKYFHSGGRLTGVIKTVFQHDREIVLFLSKRRGRRSPDHIVHKNKKVPGFKRDFL